MFQLSHSFHVAVISGHGKKGIKVDRKTQETKFMRCLAGYSSLDHKKWKYFRRT